MNENLISYYNDRAKEYDRLYQIPEEQENLLDAAKLFQKIFADKNVLEIACGTGYWTQQIDKTANSILATDINKTMINIARERRMKRHVVFEEVDMYLLSTNKKLDGIFGGFIWSHILLQDLDHFLLKIKDLIIENGDIVFIDSKAVDGTSHDKNNIVRIDQYGNTFQMRQLENGSTHEILKNFPTKDFLYNKLSNVATNISFVDLEYYWIVTCSLK